MIIPCFRCGKELNSPDASNAEYIIAEDTKAMELAEDGAPVEIQKQELFVQTAINQLTS